MVEGHDLACLRDRSPHERKEQRMSCILGFMVLGSTIWSLPDDTGTIARESRTITVTGQASVKVVPDRVIIVIGVETTNKDLAVAKKDHDERIRRLLTLPAKFKIDAKDVQTDYVRIDIIYDWESRHRAFDYYRIDQSIAITLKDVS